jgi:hypothetical protein
MRWRQDSVDTATLSDTTGTHSTKDVFVAVSRVTWLLAALCSMRVGEGIE